MVLLQPVLVAHCGLFGIGGDGENWSLGDEGARTLAALTPFSQSFDHFGDVQMQIYDLAKAWESFRAQQERHFVTEEGSGSDYQCVHDAVEFRYRVTDWEPFSYFSTVIQDSLRPGLKSCETYQVTATEEGTELRYAMGPLHDDNNVRHEAEEKELTAFLAGFWPVGFDAMEKLIAEKGGSGAAIES